jgi:hypothetical protein
MTIPAPPHEHDHYVKWLGKLPAFFERGKIQVRATVGSRWVPVTCPQPLPTKSFGGLEDMPSAFRAVLEGRNRVRSLAVPLLCAERSRRALKSCSKFHSRAKSGDKSRSNT